MAVHQYAEGLRRGLDYCPKRSSVNDGALWIKRITATNFPGVPQIVDWSHAAQHLWVGSPMPSTATRPRSPNSGRNSTWTYCGMARLRRS